MYGSPTVTSTPGGTEIGVRPSLDCCDVDAENDRRACVAGALASAGTRKDGSVIIGEEQMAALVLLGASMVAGCLERVAALNGLRRARVHNAKLRWTQEIYWIWLM